MKKDEATQVLAQEIADATVAGCLSSKQTAVWLYAKGYRLLPDFHQKVEELFRDIAQFDNDTSNPLWTVKWEAYVTSKGCDWQAIKGKK